MTVAPHKENDMSQTSINELKTSGAPCCGPSCCQDHKAPRAAAEVTAAVQKSYGAVAVSDLSTRDAGVRAVAEAFGYTPDELASIPAEANMGLSCGNPTATANLRTGEVVVDLGSGGGLDVFLAAKKVGPTGRAIGIDVTEAMIERARKGAAEGGYVNVEFHLASIDKLPLPDASVDVVISNCVINLAPDKNAVFREIARVLKPGGRVALSDISLKKSLPPELGRDLMAYVGCIAGAIEIGQYEQGLRDAGFAHVQVIDSGADLNAYAKVEGQAGCCSPATAPAAPDHLPVAASCCSTTSPAGKDVHGGLADLISRYDINEFAASVKVFALKPA